jgi:hypothetical protein
VRNSEKPCNGILLLPSASLPLGRYRAALLAHLDAVGAGPDRFAAIAADIRMHCVLLV